MVAVQGMSLNRRSLHRADIYCRSERNRRMAWECVKAGPQDSLDLLARMTTCVKGVRGNAHSRRFRKHDCMCRNECVRVHVRWYVAPLTAFARALPLQPREDLGDGNTTESGHENARACESVPYAAVGVR